MVMLYMTDRFALLLRQELSHLFLHFYLLPARSRQKLSFVTSHSLQLQEYLLRLRQI